MRCLWRCLWSQVTKASGTVPASGLLCRIHVPPQRATHPTCLSSLPDRQVPRTVQRAVLQLCARMVPAQSPAAAMAESGARATSLGPQQQVTSAALATRGAVMRPELGQRTAPGSLGKMSDALSGRTRGPVGQILGTDHVPDVLGSCALCLCMQRAWAELARPAHILSLPRCPASAYLPKLKNPSFASPPAFPPSVLCSLGNTHPGLPDKAPSLSSVPIGPVPVPVWSPAQPHLLQEASPSPSSLF